MKYAYWGVICKTSECGFIPAKFIGPYDPKISLYERPEYLPDSWTIPCAGCGESHRYTPDDLQVKASNVAPPQNFQGWW
jgi:hypothetical protein